MAEAHTINGYHPDVIASFVSRIENLHDEIESEHGTYMERVKEIREAVKEVLQEAADNENIPKRALKLKVEERAAERRIARKKASLEAEDSHAFEMIDAALGQLGDTPLGEAAKRAAKRGKRTQGSDARVPA